MSKVHERILEIHLTNDESDDTSVITAVNWFGHRGATARAITITAGAAAVSHETELGESNIPPPTHIRLVTTNQA